MDDDRKPTTTDEAVSKPPPTAETGRPTPTGEMLDDDALDALCDETLHAIDLG